jgi:hypothetical protein
VRQTEAQGDVCHNVANRAATGRHIAYLRGCAMHAGVHASRCHDEFLQPSLSSTDRSNRASGDRLPGVAAASRPPAAISRSPGRRRSLAPPRSCRRASSFRLHITAAPSRERYGERYGDVSANVRRWGPGVTAPISEAGRVANDVAMPDDARGSAWRVRALFSLPCRGKWMGVESREGGRV